MPSPFVWFDLRTPGADAAQRFYADLLGWEVGDAGAVVADGHPWGAVVEEPELAGGLWMPYIQVENVDDATARAVGLGAEVIEPKQAGPAGFFTVVTDPTGGHIALWQGPDDDET